MQTDRTFGPDSSATSAAMCFSVIFSLLRPGLDCCVARQFLRPRSVGDQGLFRGAA